MYPGNDGFIEGMGPHGSWQKLWINELAAEDLASPQDGSIIIKGKYLEMDDAALDTLTLMKKIAGYNPDEADWFWVHFLPDGAIMEDDMGIKMAGKVGEGGGGSGCIPCHASAGGGDFLFVND